MSYYYGPRNRNRVVVDSVGVASAVATKGQEVMTTRKQIIERVIEQTKADELVWKKTGVPPACNVYEAQILAMIVSYDGALNFIPAFTETDNFVIDAEELDEDRIGITLEHEINKSIDRQIPEWVTKGLWPPSEEELERARNTPPG